VVYYSSESSQKSNFKRLGQTVRDQVAVAIGTQQVGIIYVQITFDVIDWVFVQQISGPTITTPSGLGVKSAPALPLVPKPVLEPSKNLHQPSATASLQQSDNFDEYASQPRDPWRREWHARDREQEKEQKRASEATRREHMLLEKARAETKRYDQMYREAMARDDARRKVDAGGGRDGSTDTSRIRQNPENGGLGKKSGAKLNSKHSTVINGMHLLSQMSSS
jgi:hypothetical protein